MAKASEQLAAANAKVTDVSNAVDSLLQTFTDFANDVRQALTTINADTLTPTAQAQMDQLLAKTDAVSLNLGTFRDQMVAADAEVEAANPPSDPTDPNPPVDPTDPNPPVDPANPDQPVDADGNPVQQ